MVLKMLFTAGIGLFITNAQASSFGEILVLPDYFEHTPSTQEVREEVEALRVNKELCSENHLKALLAYVDTLAQEQKFSQKEAKKLSTRVQNVIKDCRKAGLIQ